MPASMRTVRPVRARSARSLLRVIAALLALGVGAGCVVEARDPAERGSASAAAAETGTLLVHNETSKAIFKVRISRVEDPSWGEDKLGAVEVVMPGEERGWAVPPGAYLVKIEFEDGSALDTFVEYEVAAGGSTVCKVQPN